MSLLINNRLYMVDKNESLTPTELELMQILWVLKEATVRQVMDKLPKERALAYTSVSTIIRIMEKKKFIASRKEGKTHHYYPLITKTSYQQKSVKHMMSHIFNNTPSMLLQALVKSEQVDISDLEDLLNELKRK